MQFSTLGALFLEGILSFFSPCVLPLIPLYMGYLTQGAKSEEDGVISYNKSKVMLTTVFFVLGISTVFFVIALSVSSFTNAMNNYSVIFSLIGGMFLIFFGLIAMKVIEVPLFNRGLNLPFKIDLSKMNFITAYLLGFIFSFSWTPCIGPMLASAMIKAASASSRPIGMAYIGVYTLGFILMFLILGLFTESVLNLLKKYQNILRKSGFVAGAIIIALGINMIYGSFKEYDVLLAQTNKIEQNTNDSGSDELLDVERYGFTLSNGESNISLKDYLGKTIIVTFYGTWCPYCNEELYILQDIHDNRSDVEILLIATPNDGKETDIKGIEAYMKEKGFSLNVLYDTDYSIKSMYGVSGYPTTYVYKPDGSLLGYVPGYVDDATMEDIINKSLE